MSYNSLHTKEIGNRGEKTAEYILKNKGYKILERNYYSSFGEIDIIAREEDEIVFIEVKLRKLGSIESPADAVNNSKRRKIIKTAEKYLSEKNLDMYVRFDVFEVFSDPKKDFKIVGYNHIKNAFWQE